MMGNRRKVYKRHIGVPVSHLERDVEVREGLSDPG